jgi:hypothetical protein
LDHGRIVFIKKVANLNRFSSAIGASGRSQLRVAVINGPPAPWTMDKPNYQKLNTLASAAKSIKWGPPSRIMFAKKFCSST